ncbi:hypothetical protein BD413DRAFT_110610 [Trametes elegans]|nr:hypothetical protein BD413DRAFT_110610 [Trametes elegans]
MPPERVQELDALPSVSVDLGPGDGAPAIFTRKSLSSILGGSIQGLVVRCTDSASNLAQRHGIQDYLCPNLDHNAWSPTGPGKHGYMQVGLGRDSKRFNEGDLRHVFVGAGSHLQYCGWYRVLRVQPLTKEEWATLPQKVKETYSETTVKKEKSTLSSMSKEQVLTMYNSGEHRAPCVRLQCIAFDTAFYQELVCANDKFFEGKPPVLPPSAGSSARAPKRRKVAEATAGPKEHSEESEGGGG